MPISLETPFTKHVGIKYPIICGPMYPCSNPELVAAVSQAGGVGVVQPLSLIYVHGYELHEGLKKIKNLTDRPFGVNVIVEKSSEKHKQHMMRSVDIALEEGCRFFITSLGNPGWVVEKVKKFGGIVYHDVTTKKWADKAIEHGVDGLICVNNRAGGHAGVHSAQELYDSLKPLGLPLICAGGIGNEEDFINALKMGYSGVQMGTRFIATKECSEKPDYKQAIVDTDEKDIVLTERVTGIPLSVIRTPYVEQVGTKISPLSRLLFKYPLTKKWMRMWYGLTAMRNFKNSNRYGGSSKDYWQAGKCVSHIHAVESVNDIIEKFVTAAKNEK
jgi:nitronate monooxygenase